jgi:hypothetical protein
MAWKSSDSSTPCLECVEIAREFSEALGEARIANKTSWDALRALIGGTEEDAERADRMLHAYRYQPNVQLPQLPPRFRAAMRKSREHMLRTGHYSWPTRLRSK